MNAERRPVGTEATSEDLAGGLIYNQGKATSPRSHVAVTACVEIDLRVAREDQARYLRHALDGIRAGDVIKIMVDRNSDIAALYASDLRGVSVQVTADSVATRRTWVAVLNEVCGA